jgi:hypothetical protein
MAHEKTNFTLFVSCLGLHAFIYNYFLSFAVRKKEKEKAFLHQCKGK